jgi:hypothetical protein
VLEVAGCVGIALAPRRIRSPEAGEEAVRA